MLRVRLPRELGIAVEQRGAIERREEPLVGIDGEGVRSVDPLEERSRALGRERREPVGAVDVQPQAVPGGDVCDPHEVVDDPRVRRPRGCDDREHTAEVRSG